MENNVVTAVCDELARRQWLALRFNFRGCGGSAGAYGGGIEEREDVRATLDYLAGLPEVDRARLAVIGYSFGSWVGLATAASDDRARALVAISPPVPTCDFGFLTGCSRPKLLLYGDRDGFVDRNSLRGLVERLPDPKELRCLSGADHFWLFNEPSMADAVADFLDQALPAG